MLTTTNTCISRGRINLFLRIESVRQLIFPYAYPNNIAGVVNWESPPEGWFKLNVDVDVDATRGLFGFGAVVCNHDGKKVMVSGVHKCSYVDDVDFCEVEVFRFGL